MTKFELITKHATTESANWTNSELANFHYFNPHGLCEKKSATDSKIRELVNSGKCNAGALISYGSLNDYYVNKLRELRSKKRINRIQLWGTLSGINNDIENAQSFINSIQKSEG